MYKNGKEVYNKIIFSKEQTKDIIEKYLNGKSSVKIGKEYNLGHKVILRVLHENNIEVSQKKMVRKYSLNENYFDCIDTPNKAYILGFLFADGHNGISKSTVTMSLQEEDKEILEKIRVELGSSKPLEYLDYSNKHDFGYSYKNQYRLNVFSKHMCESLEKLGMVSNKSLVLKFPDIQEELYHHFIRGYFDGDGSINKYCGSFSIISTYSFVNTVNNIICNKFHFDSAKIKESSCKNGITYDLHFHKKGESEKIFNWLYNNAELFLKRKYNIYYSIFRNNSLIA